MFWTILGPVGVVVLGVFEESEAVPSFDGLAGFAAEFF